MTSTLYPNVSGTASSSIQTCFGNLCDADPLPYSGMDRQNYKHGLVRCRSFTVFWYISSTLQTQPLTFICGVDALPYSCIFGTASSTIQTLFYKPGVYTYTCNGAFICAAIHLSYLYIESEGGGGGVRLIDMM